VVNVSKRLKKINNEGELREKESMALHTTFKTGGSADLFIMPGSTEELSKSIQLLQSENIPWFILGSGANILVADKGIRGAVLSMEKLNSLSFTENHMTVGCGADVGSISMKAAEKGINAFPFLYGMPGTVGGALYMNARCYGHEISESAINVTLMDKNGQIYEKSLKPDDWAYKKSPFQKNRNVIIKAVFATEFSDSEKLKKTMNEYKKDREEKGHYRAPCAGSTFKNDRRFGQPTGKIIDKAGLRGLVIGDAKVSDWHANIIINKGNACSRDIWNLVKKIQSEILKSSGFLLEPEIIPVGEWEDL